MILDDLSIKKKKLKNKLKLCKEKTKNLKLKTYYENKFKNFKTTNDKNYKF